MNHISWKIGNRIKAKFWRDSWDGEPPLAESFKDQDWVNTIESDIGTQVVMRTWRKITIGNTQVCRKLEELLNNKSILVFDEEDRVF